jgi:general secretion pathway protein H
MPPGIRPVSGFSLLELMVVMMIIGILITFGVISLNLGDQQAKVEEEVQRIRGVLELAQEEAVLKHRELALRFDRDAYRFARLEDSKWVDFENDREFQVYTLPDGMHFYIEVKDGSLRLADTKGATSAMVYILSSGEVSPFELTIEAGDGSRYALSTDFLGRSRAYDPNQGAGP